MKEAHKNSGILGQYRKVKYLCCWSSTGLENGKGQHDYSK